MSYVLKAPLAAHFRSTGNRWQTVPEIAAEMKLEETSVRSAIGAYVAPDHMERQEYPRRYRTKPESLYRCHGPDDPRDATARLIMLRTRFCRKWGVRAPFEATRSNPEAMSEWCSLIGSR